MKRAKTGVTVVTVPMHHQHDGCKPGTKGHMGGNPMVPEGMPATPGASMAGGAGGMDMNHPALNPISNPQGFAAHHAQQNAGMQGPGGIRQAGVVSGAQPGPAAPRPLGQMNLK
jgi:hypothetical protein